ncbi:dual specificity protein phosphatase [Candidatus Koribacter versatilis Ellin345]|uniref:Dual specificity protein phosphatase n=1 Tax=Koribacter versatilis (strain Ellin345) TaxID=204669 RepID=Q1IRD6_KORVE|nr:protein-tyrosine phosphatase family protein [Candidatus Koribacter versatilis]ABF40564.1 dual specificity protein phosphatase [Candidatus Koribacter versatilis Ellin345]
MLSPLFAIEGPWSGVLAIAPAPPPEPRLVRALERWQKIGITTILSLLTPGERPGWDNEGEICNELDINFYSLPIRDHSVPRPDEMQKVVDVLTKVEARLKAGERVVAHCFAGIGRSGIATVGLLMIAGIPMEDAIDRVSLARGLNCPETEEQLEWLASFDRYRRLSYT